MRLSWRMQETTEVAWKKAVQPTAACTFSIPPTPQSPDPECPGLHMGKNGTIWHYLRAFS